MQKFCLSHSQNNKIDDYQTWRTHFWRNSTRVVTKLDTPKSGFRVKTGTKLNIEFSYVLPRTIRQWRKNVLHNFKSLARIILLRCLQKAAGASSAEFQIKLAETAEEVENVIKQYATDTRSTFVVYKKDKSFGSLSESDLHFDKKANLEFWCKEIFWQCLWAFFLIVLSGCWLVGQANSNHMTCKKGSGASLCGQASLVDSIACVGWRAFGFSISFSFPKKLNEIQAQKSLCEVRSIS